MTTRFLVSGLLGRTVVAADGTEIGRVTDVQVELPAFRVTALLVDVERSVLEKLHIDEPIIAGSRSLVLPPSQVEQPVAPTGPLRIAADVWDIGRMSFR